MTHDFLVQAAVASEAHDDLQDLLQDEGPSKMEMTLALSRAHVEMSKVALKAAELMAGYERAVEVLTEEM